MEQFFINMLACLLRVYHNIDDLNTLSFYDYKYLCSDNHNRVFQGTYEDNKLIS